MNLVTWKPPMFGKWSSQPKGNSNALASLTCSASWVGSRFVIGSRRRTGAGGATTGSPLRASGGKRTQDNIKSRPEPVVGKKNADRQGDAQGKSHANQHAGHEGGENLARQPPGEKPAMAANPHTAAARAAAIAARDPPQWAASEPTTASTARSARASPMACAPGPPLRTLPIRPGTRHLSISSCCDVCQSASPA